LSKAFKIWYGINVESREHAIRGWNWGKAEFTKAELAFNVLNRPAFEVPYSEISNTNLAGKNEVAVEFGLGGDQANEPNGQPAGSTSNRGRKAAAGPDELVEMRFYIPGTAVRTEKGIEEKGEEEKGEEEKGEEEKGEEEKGEDEKGEDEKGEEENEEEEQEEEAEAQNAATLFYETLMDKAEIGDVAGDTFATFLDVLHLTPRYVQKCSSRMQLTPPQRPFRYRYVRVLLPATRQDIRLQDPICVH
jgi:structure-specific recognition protein 1